MARPRSVKITDVPNLYASIDKVDGKYRFRYRNVITGITKRLKTRNLQQAEDKAKKLNAIIAQRIIDREAESILQADNSHSITVGKMVKLYLETLENRVRRNEIKQSTLNDRRWKIKPVNERYQKIPLAKLTTLEIYSFLKEYIEAEKARMAQSIRSILIDFFREAIAQGHFPADKPNPAEVVRAPRAKVKRARLTFEVFQQHQEWTLSNQPKRAYLANLLGLLTAQRREDVADLRLNRLSGLEKLSKRRPSGIICVDDEDHLAIIQKKTGSKVLIPLSLTMEGINYSLGEVLAMCRDNVLSEYAIHHNKHNGMAKPGSKVRLATISSEFCKAMEALDIDWGESSQPTYHELRSLAERKYKEQGINTQYLLGHKHERMTDVYHDSRGHDWLKVNAN